MWKLPPGNHYSHLDEANFVFRKIATEGGKPGLTFNESVVIHHEIVGDLHLIGPLVHQGACNLEPVNSKFLGGTGGGVSIIGHCGSSKRKKKKTSATSAIIASFGWVKG